MALPIIIPALVKGLAVVGGATVVGWFVKEVRRVNKQLENVKATPAGEPPPSSRSAHPAARSAQRRMARVLTASVGIRQQSGCRRSICLSATKARPPIARAS